MIKHERLLFGCVLVSEILCTIFLIVDKRMIEGHDALQYFSLQHFFLNNTVSNNEIPLWMPYLNQGAPAAWWFTLQGTVGILGNVFMLMGTLIKSVNFLDIFYSGILFDRILLLVGVWLLGRRYYASSLTRFFVAITVMGSTLFVTQVKFTFHLYYAVPLILYFLHAFLETSRWRYFLLTAFLFCLQMVGNDAYFLPVLSMTITLYFVFYALTHWGQMREFARNLRFGRPAVTAVAGAAILLGMLGLLLICGQDPNLLSLTRLRNADGSASLQVFLQYGANTDASKWNQLWMRLSPALDYSVYMGFLGLAMLPAALFRPGRMKYVLLTVAGILILFSSATVVSTFFYHTWPLMKFYRHLALICPLIKLFLILLAGFGFEFFVNKCQEFPKRMMVFSVLAVIMLALASFLNDGLRALATTLQGDSRSFHLPIFHMMFEPAYVDVKMAQASMWAMFFAIGFFLFLVLKRLRPLLIMVLVLGHALDIYGFYIESLQERTYVLSENKRQLLKFEPVPYIPQRTLHRNGNNPRHKLIRDGVFPYAMYASIEQFFGEDIFDSPERQDNNVYGVNVFKSMTIKHNKNLYSLGGVTRPKIQFFTNAHWVYDRRMTAELLGHKVFKGDMLLINNESKPAEASTFNLSVSPALNERIDVAHHVTGFTANTMEVDVDVPGSKPVWMLYADAWHPAWEAAVNGKHVPVYQAALAYKGLVLQPGPNAVKFYFDLPLTRQVMIFWMWMSVLGVAMVFYWAWFVLRRPDTYPS